MAESTLPAMIRRSVDLFGDHPALRDGAITLDYRELDALRHRAAAAFLAAGLERGDRIAIWAPNIYEWIIAAIGAQSIGVTLVPVNTRWKGAEVAYALNMSRARLLFTVGEFLGADYPAMLSEQALTYIERIVILRQHADEPDVDTGDQVADSWHAFLAAGDEVAPARVTEAMAAVRPDDILDIGFTSGTTGAPKGVVTTHEQNLRVFETWSATVGLREDDVYMIINPFFHSFGYKAGWLAAIMRGALILPVLSFDLDAVMAQIQRDGVTMLPGAPTIYQSLLAHANRDQYDLSSLRLAVTGAAPVPVELVNRMRNELAFEVVVTAYGLTETSGVVTICRPDDPAEVISGSSGRAMDGVEVRTVDTEGVDVPVGEPGEVWVRGYNVMQCYLDNPEATAETITPDGWLRTGDIGVLDADGYLQITDRLKDMFIVGGFNCYPAEIENLLCSHAAVAQAAVIGMPDDRLGEVACAFVVLRPGAGCGADALIAWCRDNMANYKVPRAVHVLESLPVNASGKVLKTELRDRVAV
ncbi:MAG: FadD3 family acyl-CoA ligase [Halieaceae bacterium]|jgi:acyl-CoA synthetase (AMP-forming)/AMP-acid ligase II|nr:FadD3 family acyl-CoA ligase [Halieaceae bacterium]